MAGRLMGDPPESDQNGSDQNNPGSLSLDRLRL